jgi:hydrogenase 3 maturation protease
MNFEDFRQIVAVTPSEKLLFIGLGNEICGDDSAGLALSEMLKKRKEFANSHFIFAGTTPENYLHEIISTQSEAVVFIDAVRMGEKPGTIEFVERNRISSLEFSTHSYSVTLIESFLSANGFQSFYYLGIEPLTTTIGEQMSKTISESLTNFFNGS